MFKNRLVRITLVAAFLLSLMFGAMHLYQPMPTPDNEHPTAPLGMQVDEAEAMHLDTHRQVLSRDNDDVTVTWTEIDLSSYIPKGTEHVHLGLQIKEDDECANQSYLIVREKNDSESPWYLHPAVGTDPDADTDTGTTLDDYWVYNDVTVGVDKDGKIEYYILVGSGCSVDTRINLWGWDAPVEAVVNVTAYGADGTDTWPDQQAFLDAIADVEDGGVLYIPTGTYKIQAQLSINSKSMTIRGEGPEKTVLLFTGSDGIVVSTNDTDKVVEIRDLSLETDYAGTFTAIKLQGQDVDSNSEPQFFVQNVAIRPETYLTGQDTDYWATGIELYEGWDTKIDHVYIGGQLNRIEDGTKGIRLRSQTVNVTIHDMHAFFLDKAISVEDNCQGIFINDLIAVHVNWGVYVNLAVNNALVEVLGGHIDAFDGGIYFYRAHQSTIASVLIYRNASSTTTPFYGIFLSDSDEVTIVGNRLKAWTSNGDAYAIRIQDDSDYVAIAGNSATGWDYNLSVAGGCNYEEAANVW